MSKREPPSGIWLAGTAAGVARAAGAFGGSGSDFAWSSVGCGVGSASSAAGSLPPARPRRSRPGWAFRSARVRAMPPARAAPSPRPARGRRCRRGSPPRGSATSGPTWTPASRRARPSAPSSRRARRRASWLRRERPGRRATRPCPGRARPRRRWLPSPPRGPPSRPAWSSSPQEPPRPGRPGRRASRRRRACSRARLRAPRPTSTAGSVAGAGSSKSEEPPLAGGGGGGLVEERGAATGRRGGGGLVEERGTTTGRRGGGGLVEERRPTAGLRGRADVLGVGDGVRGLGDVAGVGLGLGGLVLDRCRRRGGPRCRLRGGGRGLDLGGDLALDRGEQHLRHVEDLDLLAGLALGLLGGQPVGEHDPAERAADRDLVGAGLDGLDGAVHVDPLADVLLHPHARAAGAAAEGLLGVARHLDEVGAGQDLEQLARRGVDAVVAADVARVVVGDRALRRARAVT